MHLPGAGRPVAHKYGRWRRSDSFGRSAPGVGRPRCGAGTAAESASPPLRGDHPAFQQEIASLDDHPAFEPHTDHSVPFLYETDRDRYLAFVASMSFVASRAPDERADILARVAALLPDEPFAIRYRTLAWLSRRRGS